MSWAEALAEFQSLFNAGRFFEAHERLEAFWMTAEGPEKLCAQGLIQVAAGFHKSPGRGRDELLAKGADKVRRGAALDAASESAVLAMASSGAAGRLALNPR